MHALEQRLLTMTVFSMQYPRMQSTACREMRAGLDIDGSMEYEHDIRYAVWRCSPLTRYDHEELKIG